MKNNYIKLFDKAIFNLFGNLLNIIWRWPNYFYFVFITFFRQKKAARLRSYWRKSGVHVPPFMIASITSQCNLKCAGCYAMKLQHHTKEEMSSTKLNSIIQEASELGVSIILLAGGEPMSRKDILKITSLYPQIIFPMFTNGTLLDNQAIRQIKQQKNLVPILSLEGYKDETDNRRGEGIYSKFLETAAAMQKGKVFFGVSLTITSKNFETIISDNYIKTLLRLGTGIVFLISYIPAEEGTEHLVLSDEQQMKLDNLTYALNKKHPALFIAFPGDEEQFGGCLSSGRGFIHINSEGSVEPCPFAPFSDSSLKDMSLKNALSSNLLKNIRENYRNLSKSNSGCTLWDNQKWVESQLTVSSQ